MSRRDTIIIAVLVNAGLLTILFATAMRVEPEVALAPTFVQQELVLEESEPLPSPPAATEEKEPTTPTVSLLPSLVDEKEEVLTLAQEPEETLPELTVKRGDTLDKIARKNGVTVSAIVRENSLSTTDIRIGQTLRVPQGGEAPPPAAREESSYYVVQKGDSPWKIARRYGVELADLLRMNALDEDKARRLKPGDRIRIR